MKRTALPSLALITIVAVVAGCQTAPRFAWWKHDKAPDDSSAVARSASPSGNPALPSAQTKPEAVAVAGLTPAAPPSSTNLAAAGSPAGAAAGALASKTPSATAPLAAHSNPTAPSVPIPVTSSTLANAPVATYPTENGLAEKLVGTPSAKSAAAVPSATGVPAGGPYDPNGYKPSASLAARNPNSTSGGADRYGVSTSAPSAAMAALPNSPPPLASDPADRYGSSPNPLRAGATPAATALADPAAIAADRSSNPTLPMLPNQPAVAASAAATASQVRLASAPGGYRPGRTSSYTGGSATPAVEVASRPSPPSATTPATPSATGANSAASQPWTPPAPSTTPPTGTRTY
jgi:hypothetical protein